MTVRVILTDQAVQVVHSSTATIVDPANHKRLESGNWQVDMSDESYAMYSQVAEMYDHPTISDVIIWMDNKMREQRRLN